MEMEKHFSFSSLLCVDMELYSFHEIKSIDCFAIETYKGN